MWFRGARKADTGSVRRRIIITFMVRRGVTTLAIVVLLNQFYFFES